MWLCDHNHRPQMSCFGPVAMLYALHRIITLADKKKDILFHRIFGCIRKIHKFESGGAKSLSHAASLVLVHHEMAGRMSKSFNP
jgi:hypothetical protein